MTKVLQNYSFVFVLKLYQVQHVFYYITNIIVISSNYTFNKKYIIKTNLQY